MKKSLKAALSALVGAFALVCTNAHANLVTNGDFETSNFSGWSVTGNTGFTSVQGFSAHSGNYGADLGPVGSDGHLTQVLTTVAGAQYELDFWLRNNSGTPNDFSVNVDGNLAANLVNSGPFPYTLFTYNFVASTNSTTLQFNYRQDPNFWYLDDISVNGAVPEPATLAIFGFSLLGLGATRRRKQ